MMIFKYCFHNTCTYKAFVDLIKIVHVILNAKILPESLQFYNNIFDKSVKKEFHAVCPFCNQYYLGKIDNSKKKKMKCKRCRVVVDVAKASFAKTVPKICVVPSRNSQKFVCLIYI